MEERNRVCSPWQAVANSEISSKSKADSIHKESHRLRKCIRNSVHKGFLYISPENRKDHQLKELNTSWCAAIWETFQKILHSARRSCCQVTSAKNNANQSWNKNSSRHKKLERVILVKAFEMLVELVYKVSLPVERRYRPHVADCLLSHLKMQWRR